MATISILPNIELGHSYEIRRRSLFYRYDQFLIIVNTVYTLPLQCLYSVNDGIMQISSLVTNRYYIIGKLWEVVNDSNDLQSIYRLIDDNTNILAISKRQMGKLMTQTPYIA